MSDQTNAELSPPVQDFLKALASDTRQQMLLLFAGGEEVTVGDVANRMGIGQSTASQQLALLQRGGILSRSRSGNTVRYRANAVGISRALYELRSYLLFCCPPEEAD